MLKRAGPDGMSKVVNEFTNNHPEISKRQTELKVFEVAVKEKQQDDTKQVRGISVYPHHFKFPSSTPLLI